MCERGHAQHRGGIGRGKFGVVGCSGGVVARCGEVPDGPPPLGLAPTKRHRRHFCRGWCFFRRMRGSGAGASPQQRDRGNHEIAPPPLPVLGAKHQPLASGAPDAIPSPLWRLGHDWPPGAPRTRKPMRARSKPSYGPRLRASRFFGIRLLARRDTVQTPSRGSRGGTPSKRPTFPSSRAPRAPAVPPGAGCCGRSAPAAARHVCGPSGRWPARDAPPRCALACEVKRCALPPARAWPPWAQARLASAAGRG